MAGIQDEAARIRNIKHWPIWPWLPIKRKYDGLLQTATIYADDIDFPDSDKDNGPIRVLDLNVWDTSIKLAIYLTNGGDPEELGIKVLHTYTDVEGMLDDGWKGD